MHQHVEMIGHNQTERHKPFTRHMVVPHGFQNHRRIFNKIRHATRPGTDCHEEERPRKAIRRVVIEAFTDRQIVHVFQCSTNEMPVQRPHHCNATQERMDAGGRYVRAGRRGRRPLPTPHSRGVQDRTAVARRAVYMVGAAGDVGPYQRHTAVVCRAAQPWRAGPYTW